jgi:PAS domain S-box-containing protein
VVQDLSPQKRTERALRSENAFRAGIIQCAAEGICVCHEIPVFPFVHFTVWNERMQEITGYTLSEINREGWYQSLYPDPEVRQAARARMARMREGDNLRDERWEITTRSGERRPVTISTSVLAGEDETVHVLGLIQDVAERVRAERELRDREADLRTVLNSIGDAVIAVDTDRRVRRMNPAAEGLTGWSAGEARGRPLSEVYRIVDEDTRRPSPPDRGTQAGARLALIGRDSAERLVAETVAPLRNERGEIQGRVFVFRDITERIRLEDRLHQAQKMEAIGQLAGGVAHDFNNMLGGILGAAEMMEIRAGEDPKLRRLIRLIFEGARKASDLTQKLLAFGRKGKVRSTPVNLHEVVRDAVHLLERSIDRRIIICLDLAASDPVTTGDPAQLQNALLNLGINARDAMPEGGRITIASRIVHFDAPPEWSEGLSVPAGDYVEVTVTDIGGGIPDEVRTRVFEPFFTTKETGRGTGLGLAAVFGTLQEHGGGIRLESEPGKGTTFSLYFRHVPDADPLHVPEESEVHRGQGRILLVEDEPIVRAMGEDLLREMGYEVVSAVDGLGALELFERESGRFDLVILDMVMPRLNGRDTFFALRLADPDVRVLLSSGFSHGLHLREALDAGAAGFIQKPYTRASLGRMLAEVLP